MTNWYRNYQNLIKETKVIKLKGFSSHGNVDDFIDEWYNITDTHPYNPKLRIIDDVMVDLSKWGSNIHISDIKNINTQGSGAGSDAMKTICELADKHNINIELIALGYDNTSTDKLKNWYEKFGFVVTGGNKTDGYDMIRNPIQT